MPLLFVIVSVSTLSREPLISIVPLPPPFSSSVFALRDAFGWKGLAMPNRYVKRVARSAREAVEQHGRRTAALLRGEDDAEVVELKRQS